MRIAFCHFHQGNAYRGLIQLEHQCCVEHAVSTREARREELLGGGDGADKAVHRGRRGRGQASLDYHYGAGLRYRYEPVCNEDRHFVGVLPRIVSRRTAALICDLFLLLIFELPSGDLLQAARMPSCI